MKSTILKTLFTILFFTTILSCSSDSGSDCIPIACLNGGTSNSNCGCNCPTGYSGANCATAITPTSMSVTRIRVTSFPNTDTGGALWDFPSSNADISVVLGRITAPTTVLWSSPNYFADALSNGSNFYDFAPATPIVISQVQAQHLIELFDYDGADPVPSANDSMGALSFTPYSVSGGFPSTIQLSSPSGVLKFELSVTYQW